MSEFLQVLNAVVPVFAIALIGLFVRKLNWLNESADQSLLRLNINLLFPCLVLDSTLGNPALSQLSNLVLAPLVGFGTIVLGLALAALAWPLHGLKEARARRTFSATVGIYNYSYVPLPLAWMLFDERTVGVLFVHNVGVETAMWTLAVLVLSGGAGRDWRKLINGPLLAIVFALVLNALGWNKLIPDVVHTTFKWLGQCAIPLSLILIGAVVADHLGEFHSQLGWRVMGVAVLLRILVLPALFLALAIWLPATIELRRVILLQAAMPAAVFPIVMARHYGGDAPTALRVVLSTSVTGLVTIPLWIRLGLHYVGR